MAAASALSHRRADGLVRAIDQLDFTDTPTSGTLIDDSGEAFMHGATVGMEARW